MPGVQKPHCMASLAMNCSWIGVSLSPSASPSMVVTSRVPTSTASVMHDETGVPSRCTVQALHEPRSHTTLVPVRPSVKRSASASVVDGSTFTWWMTRLTFIVSATSPGPCTLPAAASAASASDVFKMPAAATVRLVPVRKLRRVMPEGRSSSLIVRRI